MMTKYNKVFEKVKLVYVFAFITYLLLSRMVMFVNLIGIRTNEIIFMMLAGAGGIIVAAEVLTHFKKYLKVQYYILLAFWLVCLVSSIVNRGYGFSDNMKTLVWMAIQMFLLFSLSDGMEKERFKNFLKHLSRTSICIWFVGVTISFGQFLLAIKYMANFSEYARRQGFVDERLFGIFSDPNYASVTSIVIVLFTVMLYLHEKKKAWKVFYVVSGIMELFYILLSGSRTALVSCYVTFPIFLFLVIRNRIQKSDKALIYSLGTTVVLACFLTFTAPLFVNMTDFTKQLRPLFGLENEQKKVSLSRTDTKDPTNNRFKIWQSAFEVSGDNRVVGLSPRNLTPYAKANYPNSYIAKSEYQAHNGYLAVLVGSGILGCIVVLIFAVFLIRKFAQYALEHKKKKYDTMLILGISGVLPIAASICFCLDIFFVNTYTAALFFLFCGMIVTYGGKEKSDECEG